MGVIAKEILRGCQGLSTLLSLGYPLSVFNKKTLLSGLHQSIFIGKLRECRSTRIQSGASGLPYYCAPLVCVSNSDVMELITVWLHIKPKTKKLDLSDILP